MAPVRGDGGIEMSDTPRTDAHNWKDGDYDDPLHAFYDFARTLERELNATNATSPRRMRMLFFISVQFRVV